MIVWLYTIVVIFCVERESSKPAFKSYVLFVSGGLGDSFKFPEEA